MSSATECPRCTAALKYDGEDLVGCVNGCALFLIREGLGLDPPFVPSNGNGADPIPLSDERATVQQSPEQLLEGCRTLAREERILDRLRELLPQIGLVGEDENALLIYLAVTSRLLDNPVSVAVKGPSSGGKSWTVERVLQLIPDEGYHALSAMSERALVYSKVPLKHRMLVIFEAAGMTGDFASYLIRSLLNASGTRRSRAQARASCRS